MKVEVACALDETVEAFPEVADGIGEQIRIGINHPRNDCALCFLSHLSDKAPKNTLRALYASLQKSPPPGVRGLNE
jgi:hypothetical protein